MFVFHYLKAACPALKPSILLIIPSIKVRVGPPCLGLKTLLVFYEEDL
jgi:hypothetical protein